MNSTLYVNIESEKCLNFRTFTVPDLKVIKLEHSLRLKIKRNDWLLADMSASSQSLHFILSLRMNSSFII